MRKFAVALLLLLVCVPVLAEGGYLLDLGPVVIGDQEGEASCAAWAISTAKSIQDGVLLSPAYIYNQRPLREGEECKTDSGMWANEAMEIMADQGIAPLALFPLVDKCTEPDLASREAAREYKGTGVRLFCGKGDADIEIVKTRLRWGYPVIAGLPLYPSFDWLSCGRPIYDGPRDGWDDQVEGYHYVTLIGYADNGFRFINSYGIDWGCDGFGIISFECFKRDIWEAWIIEDDLPYQAYVPLVRR